MTDYSNCPCTIVLIYMANTVYLVNIIPADALAANAAMTSAGMILTYDCNSPTPEL